MTLPLLPYLSLMLSLLFSSIVLLISSNNWLFMWVGLELNLIAFIPLISCTTNNQEVEARVKYFLVQAVRSGVLLFTLIINSSLLPHTPSTAHSSLILLLCLTIKAGMAPCFFWFPQVINSINWFTCLILSTLQKFNPLFLLFTLLFSWSTILVLIICAINRAVGGVGGLNQTQIRALLAYSSIGHMSWILAASGVSSSLSLSYLAIYILLTASIILIIIQLSKVRTNQFRVFLSSSLKLNAAILLSLLSLAGLPPLLGFFPKWSVMSLLSPISMFLVRVLVLGSLITLFYYLSVFFLRNIRRVKSTKPLYFTQLFSSSLIFSSSMILVLIVL